MSEENALTGSEQPVAPSDQAASTEAKIADQKQEETAAPEPDAAKSEDARDETPKPKSRAKERIEGLSREVKNLKRALARANQKIGQQRAVQLPREEQYQDPARYQADIATHAAKAATLEAHADELDDQLKTLSEKRGQAWAELAAEAKAAMPDFDSVFDNTVPVSEAMADLIMEADNPAQIAYWLGKNRAEARRIYDMPPVEAARELGRLEARLSAPKPKMISNAPKPVETVSGKAHQMGKTPSDMNYDEYKAWRMAQMKRK